MRILSLRRRDTPEWEVVDHKMVQPVPTFYDDEDVEILSLSSSETRATYVFDVRSGLGQSKRPPRNKLHKRGDTALQDEQGRKALIFARQMLLAEVQKKDFNCLLQEGWCLTVFRKGKRNRIEVQYQGRGALAVGKLAIELRQPPFMELLKSS